MTKDDRQIINHVVDFLESKLETEFHHFEIYKNSVSWRVLDTTPDDSKKDKLRKASVISKVSISYYDRRRDEDYNCDFLMFEVSLHGTSGRTDIPLTIMNRFKQPIRRARRFIKKANSFKCTADLCRIDTVLAKIQPNRIDDILMGDGDEKGST